MPVCDIAKSEQICFMSFSFAALNAAMSAVIMPVIFNISNSAGVRFKSGKILRSRNIPCPGTIRLIIIENTGFGACELPFEQIQKGYCALFIIAPTINKKQITF